MAKEEGTRKDAQFMVISITPDVCKSPAAPVPYPIVGYFDKSIQTSTNVRSAGEPVFHMGSRISTVIGDEAGAGGGVVSNCSKGYCKPVVPIDTVRINGEFANRHHKTLMLMNGASPDGPFNTLGQVKFLGEMLQADVEPGGTIKLANPPVEPETEYEAEFLADLESSAGLSDFSGDAQQSAPQLGAGPAPQRPSGARSNVGQALGQIRQLLNRGSTTDDAEQPTEVDWTNPGAALGDAMRVAGQSLGGSSS